MEGSAPHLRVSAPSQRGVDIQDIRDLLGHTSTRMTERYAHGARGTLHEAVNRLNRTTEVPPGVPPALETPSQTVAAGGENPKAARGVRGSGRYWDRTSDPRLVRPMLYR